MHRNCTPTRPLASLALCAAAAGLSLLLATPALAATSGAERVSPLDEVEGTAYTGWAEGGSELYWLDSGVVARDKQAYDPETDAWYWFDADGTMAHDKDAYIPESNDVDRESWLSDDAYRRANGKWVRYDSAGRMVKGLDETAAGAYYFDPVTGEMLRGEHYLPLDGGSYAWYHFDDVTGVMDVDKDVYVPSNGGKWVRYDERGRMVKGEDRRVSDVDGKLHTWYFDLATGAMYKGLSTVPASVGVLDGSAGDATGEKTVCFDPTYGWMLYGSQNVNGAGLEFDEVTGELESNPVVAIAYSLIGCPYKYAGRTPDGFSCDGFTAYVYDTAGIRVYESLADSSFYGQSRYLASLGKLVYSRDQLTPGDIIFFGQSLDSLRHAAIYIGRDEDGTQLMIHSAGHYVDGVRIGVTIAPLDADFLAGGSPL